MSLKTGLLAVLASLILSCHLWAENSDIRFCRLSIEDGLSQNAVFCILQDRKGFMWFGTEDGLNKYDGYTFEVFKTGPVGSNTLSSSWAKSIYEDREGIIWIGTNGGGLTRFDPIFHRFSRFTHNLDDPAGINNNVINSIVEDPSGALWIGTWGGGLNCLDRENGEFTHYVHNPEDPDSLSENRIYSIFVDSSGILWIGTAGGGLDRFVPEEKKFIHHTHNPQDPNSLSDDRIHTIYEVSSEPGVLWIGTDGGGLNRFDIEKERFTHYTQDPRDPNSLRHDVVTSIHADHAGVLWIGTAGGGLHQFVREENRFIQYSQVFNDPYSLSHNFILSIYEDRSGVLWVGTAGGGLNKFERVEEKFTLYQKDPGNPDSLSEYGIRAIYEDQSGVLWLGTYGGGISKFDRKNGEIKHYTNIPDNPSSLSHDRVFSIYEDKEGVFWFGTAGGVLNKFNKENESFIRYLTSPESLSENRINAIYEDSSNVFWTAARGGGLYQFDRERERFISFRYDPRSPDSLGSDDVYCIYEDREDVLWIGTIGGGLNKYVREENNFIRYMHNPDDPNSLSDNFVMTIYEDQFRRLWIGTNEGLNKFNPITETFTCYKEEDGLPNSVIYAILEDSRGNLWLSTNKGLSRFNPQTETFKNYDVSDGLQSNEFNGGAYFKSKSGEMFFGGVNGLNIFFPDYLPENSFIPPVVITNFLIFNKPLIVGEELDGHTILQKSITDTEEIRLSYRFNVFSFEFAALNYVHSEKNEYRFMLEGLDKDWNMTREKRFAAYTTLPPGDYIFRVKGSNNDGIWNEEGVSIKIKIIPPFWRTYWFLACLILFGISLVYGSYRYRTRLLHIQAKKLESTVKERTVDLMSTNTKLLQEIDERKRAERALRESEKQIKSSLKEKEVLLKEIHHRVKNNMQIISSLLRLQSGKIDDKRALGMFKESQHRIASMSLIHEIFYRSENFTEIDFSFYIRRLAAALRSMYGMENIVINQKVEDVFLDINRAIPCGLIINELISNSLKHAFPETTEGSIDIQMRKDDEKYTLVISDTGTGIPDHIDFRNTDSLGLQLVTSLVAQLDGKLELKQDKGTKFTLTF